MNIPQVEVIERELILVINSGFYDGFKGCYWHLHDLNSDLVSWGQSRGYGGDGMGSALSAMKLGKSAAQKFLAKCRIAGIEPLKNQYDEFRQREYQRKLAEKKEAKEEAAKDKAFRKQYNLEVRAARKNGRKDVSEI
jgi:hypothetical protein